MPAAAASHGEVPALLGRFLLFPDHGGGRRWAIKRIIRTIAAKATTISLTLSEAREATIVVLICKALIPAIGIDYFQRLNLGLAVRDVDDRNRYHGNREDDGTHVISPEA